VKGKISFKSIIQRKEKRKKPESPKRKLHELNFKRTLTMKVRVTIRHMVNSDSLPVCAE
jgi:hypothetical protein